MTKLGSNEPVQSSSEVEAVACQQGRGEEWTLRLVEY